MKKLQVQSVACCIIVLTCVNSLAIDTMPAHFQNVAGFKCCPPTYVFDHPTLSCICPSNTPFVNAKGECTPCNPPGKWNAKTLNCDCPAETPYFTTTGTCVSCNQPNFWNCDTKQCARCPGTMTYDPVGTYCSCPAATPHLDFENQCVACTTSWNAIEAKCV